MQPPFLKSKHCLLMINVLYIRVLSLINAFQSLQNG